MLRGSRPSTKLCEGISIPTSLANQRAFINIKFSENREDGVYGFARGRLGGLVHVSLDDGTSARGLVVPSNFAGGLRLIRPTHGDAR
jgi:hypothetical protein